MFIITTVFIVFIIFIVLLSLLSLFEMRAWRPFYTIGNACVRLAWNGAPITLFIIPKKKKKILSSLTAVNLGVIMTFKLKYYSHDILTKRFMIEHKQSGIVSAVCFGFFEVFL